MKVHYNEGVANHIGPEPCAGVREDVGEASVPALRFRSLGSTVATAGGQRQRDHLAVRG